MIRTRITVCLLFALAVLAQTTATAANSPSFAREPVVVEYDVDPTWPQQPEHVSPDGWVSGMAIDSQNRIWLLRKGPDPVQVYAADGVSLERIDIDRDSDERPERVLRYSAGLLELESWDSNTDGRFDRFQHFDESGSLTLLEEDLDFDGVVDVRTLYRDGQLTRREITNP